MSFSLRVTKDAPTTVHLFFTVVINGTRMRNIVPSLALSFLATSILLVSVIGDKGTTFDDGFESFLNEVQELLSPKGESSYLFHTRLHALISNILSLTN